MKRRLLNNSLVATFSALALMGAQTVDAGLRIGDKAADGTIYAGNNFAAAPADAPGTYTWSDGKKYCEDLVANGHADWTLPTEDQLDHLYHNKTTGSFAGTFNEIDSYPYGTYWSSTTNSDYRDLARVQYFDVGGRGWGYKAYANARVRCVRSLAP